MAKQKGWQLALTIIVAGGIWYSLKNRKKKLQIITTKNRVFMVDNADDYYKLGLPRDESIKSMKWVTVQ
jgi:hypothetical protein